MPDYRILDGDQGTTTFLFDETSDCTVRLTGVHGDFLTELTTSEELKIILVSDVLADRNKQLYSKDMKGEKEFDNLLEVVSTWRNGL